MLRSALARHWVPDVEAPPNFSVQLHLGKEGRRGPRPLNLLYRSGTTVVRSRDAAEVVGALASYLSGFGDDGSDVLLSSAAALYRNGAAVLVPRELYSVLDSFHPHLRRRRVSFVHTPFSLIDRRTGKLVVRRPAVDVDLAAIVTSPVSGARRQDPSPGRYPLKGWAFFAESQAISRAGGVALALRTVDRHAHGSQATLDTLGAVFSSAVALGFRSPGPDLAATLGKLLDD